MDTIALFQYTYITRNALNSTPRLIPLSIACDFHELLSMLKNDDDATAKLDMEIVDEQEYAEWMFHEGLIYDVEEYLHESQHPGNFQSEIYKILDSSLLESYFGEEE